MDSPSQEWQPFLAQKLQQLQAQFPEPFPADSPQSPWVRASCLEPSGLEGRGGRGCGHCIRTQECSAGREAETTNLLPSFCCCEG